MFLIYSAANGVTWLKAPLWEGDGFLLLYKKMEAVIKNALSYKEILAFIKGGKMGYEKIRTKKN